MNKSWVSNAITLFLVAAVAAVMLLEGFGGNVLPPGTPAPPFDFEKHQGGRVTSEELRGQVVLIDFWATWCGPCRGEMPWLVGLANEYEAKGVRFVAASHDDAEERKAAIDAYTRQNVPGLTRYAVYADPFTGAKYRVDALPTLYVIGRDGKIVAGTRGATSEWRVRRWLNAALEAK